MRQGIFNVRPSTKPKQENKETQLFIKKAFKGELLASSLALLSVLVWRVATLSVLLV